MLVSNLMRQFLSREVIGQGRVVDAVVRVLTLRACMPHPQARPLGLFLVLGPTGTGKLRLARGIARLVYKDPDAVLSLDVAGLPNGPALAEQILDGCQARPDSPALIRPTGRGLAIRAVVAIEQVDRAEPLVEGSLCQLADTGYLGGELGLDLTGAVVLLKSRVGAEHHEQDLSRSGFGFQSSAAEDENELDVEREALRAATARFRPGFLSRLDDVLVFRPIRPRSVPAILEQLVAELRERVLRSGAPIGEIELTQAARRLLFARASEEALRGFTSLTRLLRDNVEYPLMDLAVSGQLRVHGTIVVDATGDSLHFRLPAPSRLHASRAMRARQGSREPLGSHR